MERWAGKGPRRSAPLCVSGVGRGGRGRTQPGAGRRHGCRAHALPPSRHAHAQALAIAKAVDEKKKAEEAEEKKAEAATAAAKGDDKEPAAEPAPAQTADEVAAALLASPTGNMLVMHGNIIFEWSQVQAALSKDWRPVLDSAVAKFRAAGATEADIRGALKNHSQVESLDLGPDPEPEAEPAAAAPEAAAKPAPEAKGLPSLEVKKKAAAPKA
jgi:hypothetical protein